MSLAAVVMAWIAWVPLDAIPTPTPTADGSPNLLFVARHYPPQSLARGEEGAVDFQVVIEPSGRIRSCVVTRSSGFAALDTATCDLMIENARFQAVADPNGRRIVSRHAGTLTWTLPVGALRPAVAPVPAKVAVAEEVICRRRLKPDSNYIVTTLCLTRADWDRTVEYGRMQTNWYQGNGFVP